MKNSNFKIFLIIVSFLELFFSGCLKDNINNPDYSEDNDATGILMYLESNGDFINSKSSMDAFVNPAELFTNLQKYVVLDVRPPDAFSKGHIDSAINIKNSELINAVKSHSGENVIIVSRTGQAASYYGCLLRLDGLNNVYVLRFGMSGWNTDFSSDWQFTDIPNFVKDYLYNFIIPKPEYTSLPAVKFSTSSGDLKTKIEGRIQKLLSESFSDRIIDGTSDASVTPKDAFSNFSILDSTFGDNYIACYDDTDLYFGPLQDVYAPVHPPHSVFYMYFHDFETTRYLQTIPSNRPDIIYSKAGQYSAFATAYLRLLGYNAKSMIYGAFWRDPSPPQNNYPYVK